MTLHCVTPWRARSVKKRNRCHTVEETRACKSSTTTSRHIQFIPVSANNSTSPPQRAAFTAARYIVDCRRVEKHVVNVSCVRVETWDYITPTGAVRGYVFLACAAPLPRRKECPNGKLDRAEMEFHHPARPYSGNDAISKHSILSPKRITEYFYPVILWAETLRK